MKFVYRIRVDSPVTLKSYSGCITNAVFRRMLVVEDSLRNVIQISPLYFWGGGRYILASPTQLQPGVYGFSATTGFSTLEEMVSLVDQTHVELGGARCRVEHIEFKPVSIDTLRGSRCPELFYLTFKTPTIVGGKKLDTGVRVYEPFPLPLYVFGSLTSTWNSIVGDESLKIDTKKYLEWVRSNVVVTPPYRLESYAVRLDGGRKIPGFMGMVGYSFIDPGSYEHYITTVLARMSEYTGTGAGRRLGLGVTSYREGV